MSLIRRGGPKSIFRLVNGLTACTGYKEATSVVWEIVLAEILSGFGLSRTCFVFHARGTCTQCKITYLRYPHRAPALHCKFVVPNPLSRSLSFSYSFHIYFTSVSHPFRSLSLYRSSEFTGQYTIIIRSPSARTVF